MQANISIILLKKVHIVFTNGFIHFTDF